MQELRELLWYHNQKYHIEDAPEISDRQYDELFQELKNLEETYPEFITPDSPTQKLALTVQKEFGTWTHKGPLLSLDNTYNSEELREFDGRVKKLADTDTFSYVVEQKYDGLSIAVTYIDGVFAKAATRGDGFVGEDVTENIKTITSLPLRLKDAIPYLEVRGEVLMTKTAFEQLNEERIRDGFPVFANPRNAAAGSVRQLDPHVTASRKLDVIFYDVVYAEGLSTFMYHDDLLRFLSANGLKTAEDVVCTGIEEVIEKSAVYELQRDMHEFEVDGMVIKLRDMNLYEEIGRTEHHPRYAIAYKFKAQEEITTLLDIQVQVGRTGVLTPVAILEPVELSGVTISRASLHNMDEISKLDVRIGDQVLVKRAGEVIPKVIKSIPEKRKGTEKVFKIPDICPECAGKVVKLPEEVAYRCTNFSCKAQLAERLKYFVSKEAMDIDGVGDKLIELLVSTGIVHNFVDIYLLKDKVQEIIPILYESTKASDLVSVFHQQPNLFEEQTDEIKHGKLLKNILQAIEHSKKRPLERLITALGIKYVGKKTAKELVKHLESIWDLTRMTQEELTMIEGIGIKTAESIVDYLQQKENVELLHDLEGVGLHMKQEKVSHEYTSGFFSGKTLLFTGTLTRLSREEATRLAEENGAKVTSSISAQTDFLIAGEKAGSKLLKAQLLGVTVLTEEHFLSYCNGVTQ